MNRRQFLLVLSGTCGSSGLVLGSTLAAISNDSRYVVFPDINVLSTRVGTCAELEELKEEISDALATAKVDWETVGERYSARIKSRLSKVRTTLKRAEETASEKEKELYISTTAFSVGLILTGIGVAFSSPLVIGLALGAQILIPPTTMVVQVLWNSNVDGSQVAIGVVQDRAFMVSRAFGDSAKSSAGRILTRSLTAVQFGMFGWQLWHSNSTRKEALENARLARKEIQTLERMVARYGENRARWSNLYIKNLEYSLFSLSSYINETKQFNCLLRPSGNEPALVIRP